MRPMTLFFSGLAPMPPVSTLMGTVRDFRNDRDPYGNGIAGGAGASDYAVAPGKRTLTQAFPPSPQSIAAAVAAASATAPATANVRLATQDSVSFDDIPVGERHKSPVYAFNLHQSAEAYVTAQLEGGDGVITLDSVMPDRLRPSHEGVGTPFQLVYLPTQSGKTTATLTIRSVWPQYAGWAPVEVKIPIVATAYRYGEELPSVVEANRKRDAEQAAAAKIEREQDVALRGQTETDNKISASYPQGAENLLEDAFVFASNALEMLTDKQAIGVRTAGEEARAFKRKVPPHHTSLLTTLAMLGLDAATAGLAGMVASGVRAALAGEKGKASQVVVGIAESLKVGIKSAGKSARDALFSEKEKAGAFDDASIGFFAVSEVSLAVAKFDRTEALKDSHANLRPLMHGEKPEEAAKAMNLIGEQLKAAAAQADHLQADETRFAWMRFKTQVSLGSLSEGEAKERGIKSSANGEPVIRIESGLAAPKEGEDLPAHDGLLELEATTDYDKPMEGLRITSAKMNGVTPAMARSLSLLPLKELLDRGVVMRVHFKIPGIAVMSVVLMFDRDRIAYEDNTAAAGQESRWLSMAGGYLGAPSLERQRLGAKALRDQLTAQTLDDLGLQVETDHGG